MSLHRAALALLLLAAACGGAEDLQEEDELLEDTEGASTLPDLTALDTLRVADMIDHATAAELDRVPYVTRTIAQRIIAARPFGSQDAPILALDRVRGVGPSIIRAFRDNVDRLWCTLADGRQTCESMPVPRAPVISNVSATIDYDVDPYWEEHNDGVRVEYTAEHAMSCKLEVLSLNGGVLVTRDGVATSGPYFIGEWNSADPHSAWNPAVDVRITCTSPEWMTATAIARAETGVTPPAPPADVDCSSLRGGTFDGVAFTAEEECTAVQFINFARYSEMGALTDAGRRIAYDCTPSGACEYRSSSWRRLAEYADYAGIGATTMRALHSAIADWRRNGVAYDRVADVWQNRVALVDQPVSFDNVAVMRRLPDQVGTYTFACAEIRDAQDAPNYLTVCMQYIGADSAPACGNNPGGCLDAIVGSRASLRGTLRRMSGGAYRVNLIVGRPGAPNPNAI